MIKTNMYIMIKIHEFKYELIMHGQEQNQYVVDAYDVHNRKVTRVVFSIPDLKRINYIISHLNQFDEIQYSFQLGHGCPASSY